MFLTAKIKNQPHITKVLLEHPAVLVNTDTKINCQCIYFDGALIVHNNNNFLS